MSWFKKKQENSNLPMLPELPDLPELPEKSPMESIRSDIRPISSSSDEDIHSLPIFPNSETANKISREAIKSALEVQPKMKPYTQEIGYSKQFRMDEPEREDEMTDFTASKKTFSPEPIFIRIDKFQLAMRSISEIKRQVSEVEAYLSEIKKIKAKEEEELQEWGREILDAKNKLDNIDKILFSKL